MLFFFYVTLVSEVSARSKNPRPNIHQRSTKKSCASITFQSKNLRNLFEEAKPLSIPTIFLVDFYTAVNFKVHLVAAFTRISLFGYRRDFLRITLELNSDNFGNSFGINFGLTSGLTSGSISTLTTNKVGSSNVTSSR